MPHHTMSIQGQNFFLLKKDGFHVIEREGKILFIFQIMGCIELELIGKRNKKSKQKKFCSFDKHLLKYLDSGDTFFNESNEN